MRALFAVVGFVAFYAVTIGAIVGLGWLGVMLLGLLETIHNPKGMLLLVLVGAGCFLAAGVLAWSALPRIDRFEPPGPELTEASHPELFAMIRDVAKATEQRMPVHVYAVLDVNAFVTERGGVIGIGSRRVMGIGLGLLNAFSVDEVRAVVAHEFGHFHGGDTRLGPWVYKTRAAMGRAVMNLQNTAVTLSEIETLRIVLSIIEAPFRWMVMGYMRLASAVSRAQEFSADAVAARAVGTQPVLSGFGKLAGTAAAVDAYLDSELALLVENGVLPPVLAGARQFVEANRERMKEIDADHAMLGEASPFDSHPPLPERIAAIEALASLPALVGTKDDRSAIELLRNAEQLVHDLISARVRQPLKSIAWNEVAPIYSRVLRSSLVRYRSWLEPRSAAALDSSTETARTIAKAFPGIGEVADELAPVRLTMIQAQVYTAALSVALEQIGYEAHTAPGEPLRFHRGDAVITPITIVRAYLGGELSEQEWLKTWTDAGLGDRPWVGITWPVEPSWPQGL